MRRLEQSNHALNAAKEAAEPANISKTRFLAAASHDVLQPLNAAHLSISALAEIQTTERGRALARQVEQSLETMDELLRTLLDISRLDSGRHEAAPRGRVALRPVRRSSVGLRRHRRQTGACACASAPSGLHVRSDRAMLRRILQNIMSNALRYTRKGGVLVGARRQGDQLRIEVADTGIGIPPRRI